MGVNLFHGATTLTNRSRGTINSMKPIVQVSLDLTDINEALEMAHIAMRAGVDWLEAGTPFIIAEGLSLIHI